MYDSSMEKTHGGARRNSGRKTELVGAPTKAVTLTLDEMTVRKLKVLGEGNASRGVRLAADMAYDAYLKK